MEYPAARNCPRVSGMLSVRAKGTRKAEPMAERNTLGDMGSAQPAPSSTPPKPAASAVRQMVPALPGSCTPSSATTGFGSSSAFRGAGA